MKRAKAIIAACLVYVLFIAVFEAVNAKQNDKSALKETIHADRQVATPNPEPPFPPPPPG